LIRKLMVHLVSCSNGTVRPFQAQDDPFFVTGQENFHATPQAIEAGVMKLSPRTPSEGGACTERDGPMLSRGPVLDPN